MLEKSQFCRRLHRFDVALWEKLIQFVLFKGPLFGLSKEFIVDSFPIKICHNVRIQRSRLFPEPEYRGYIASKQEYFRGLKLHVIITCVGRPVFAWLTPGKVHDLSAFRDRKPWGLLPEGSKIYGDAGYLDYNLEAEIESQNRRLIARRRRNSSRPLHVRDLLDLRGVRQTIETVFSQVTGMMARKIHAVTGRGIQIKAMGLVAALAMAFAVV